jgi:glutamyl-tRNA reductase
MHRLLLLGLNHTTAPLDLRERLSFNPDQRAAALTSFREKFPDTEAVLLSTCNRVEIYAAGEIPPTAAALTQFLSQFHNLPIEKFQPLLYQKTDRPLIEHLFSVASSLDSMVLGETQILGQVRESYESARQLSCVGNLLHPLFQRAINVGKQVMHQTSLAQGRLSIASVAVDFAARIFDHFHDKTVLSIGAGKMANLVLQNFASLSPGKLLITNRDSAKATLLAEKFHAQAIPFNQLDQALAQVDIVITSTGSADPIITATAFAAAHRRRRFRPIFLIDIALPRDIDPAVGMLENVYLYNIDDLQQAVSQTMTGRHAEIDSAKKIVASAVDQYIRSHRARQLGPTIDQLYKRYHDLAQEELNRTLSKLPSISPAEKEHLEDLARRIVNKLLHDPVHALRQADHAHAPATQYIHAMEQLFKLTDPPSPTDDTEERPS